MLDHWQFLIYSILFLCQGIQICFREKGFKIGSQSPRLSTRLMAMLPTAPVTSLYPMWSLLHSWKEMRWLTKLDITILCGLKDKNHGPVHILAAIPLPNGPVNKQPKKQGVASWFDWKYKYSVIMCNLEFCVVVSRHPNQMWLHRVIDFQSTPPVKFRFAVAEISFKISPSKSSKIRPRPRSNWHLGNRTSTHEGQTLKTKQH